MFYASLLGIVLFLFALWLTFFSYINWVQINWYLDLFKTLIEIGLLLVIMFSGKHLIEVVNSIKWKKVNNLKDALELIEKEETTIINKLNDLKKLPTDWVHEHYYNSKDNEEYKKYASELYWLIEVGMHLEIIYSIANNFIDKNGREILKKYISYLKTKIKMKLISKNYLKENNCKIVRNSLNSNSESEDIYEHFFEDILW